MSRTALLLLAFAVCGSLGFPSDVIPTLTSRSLERRKRVEGCPPVREARSAPEAQSMLSSDVTPTTSRSLLMKRVEGCPPVRKSRSVPEPSGSDKLKIYEMTIQSRVEYRFATTLISTRIANAGDESKEATFTVDIPENAFISGFKMQVEDKVYEAYVKEKSEAKREYLEAVARGQDAGHVAESNRDSNRFTISVNIEPTHKVTFNLTYDELLVRRRGTYNLAINLDPGQPVRKMTVDVHITESRNITILRVPELRSGNEIDANESTLANTLSTTQRVSGTEAHVRFAPSMEQQKGLGHIGRPESKQALKGQFVVQYDVDRDAQTGEVLVNNGYFVHFYAPKDLQPLHKHAIFVLDVSGSMRHRKLEQLKKAMVTILDELNEGDYFNIIEFSDSVKVWNLVDMSESAVIAGRHCYEERCDSKNSSTPAFPVSPSNIAQAKTHVQEMVVKGGTNIHDALKAAINVAHVGLESVTSTEKLAPMIVFLTDGRPTSTGTDQITTTVSELNHHPQASLFSLAFGDDADLGFLRRLSLKNGGFARKIYEASDAALQLRDFYRQIASPLLANVTFNYQPDKVVMNTTTRRRFSTFFSGSEIVIAGQLANELPEDELAVFAGDILGESRSGATETSLGIRPYKIRRNNDTVTSLERLWAYLTIKQLLEKQELQNSVRGDDNNNNKTSEPKQRALELALKYSFVTSLTSLVVVKPNATAVTNLPGAEEPEEHDAASSGAGFRSFMRTGVAQPRRHRGRTKSRYPARQPADPALIPLSELQWLSAVTLGTNVTLPFGANEVNQTYTLDVTAQPESTSATCSTPTGSQGHCQHLNVCSLNVFKYDIRAYKPYFCLMNSDFAGVCCPEGLLTIPTTPSP